MPAHRDEPYERAPFDNLDFAGGGAAESPFFTAMPWIVLGVFVLAGPAVLRLRSTEPEVYRPIGRTVLEETHERT